MAYIPYTYVPIEKKARKRMTYTLPTGGLVLPQSGMTVNEGKCESICNLDILADRIKTRGFFGTSEEGFRASGSINGVCGELFADRLIFHVGVCLYGYDSQSDTVQLIYDALPDAKSLLCPFMSRLYIYCATHVYSVGDDFVLKEELDIPAPLIYESLVPGTDGGKRTENPFNLAAPRITIEYVRSTSKAYPLPQKLDTSRPVEVYRDDVLCKESLYEVYEDKIRINDDMSYDNYRVVKIVYYLSDLEEAGYDDFIGGCDVITAFGGDTNAGTRLFFTGNEKRKGCYYKSELQNPLYIGSDEFEIIGEGNENITAVKKMYGDLIIFTAGSVFKMGYTLTQDGNYFAVKEISNEAGCDCPGSVQLIDNRVVFASSKKGVFIVDAAGDTGEHNIKPISGNILKGAGLGLLDNDKKLLTSSCGVDFGRKYYLFVGNRAYIWNYDMTPFRESSSYSAAQNRLCWYMYDGIQGNYFAGAGTRLVSLYDNDGVYILSFFDDFISSYTETDFKSGISECFLPLVRKHITDMSIKLQRKTSTELTLTLYADGKRYYEAKLPMAKKQKEKLLLHLPTKALYGFGFEIRGKGEYEIEQITADYIEISE